MVTFLWAGSALGAVLGLFHGVHLFRQQAARTAHRGPIHSTAIGLYSGIWAFALWTLFGAYVLGFWILGSAGYAISRMRPQRREV